MTVRKTGSTPLSTKTPKAGDAKAPAKTEAPKATRSTNQITNRFDAKSHTGAIEMTKDVHLSAVRAQSKAVADTVMNVIGTYDKSFLLATDGLHEHVQDVAQKFISEADSAGHPGSAYSQLQKQFPGSHILLVGTGSTAKHDQVYYLVKDKAGETHKFENRGGALKEVPDANGLIFMASELGPGKKMKVRVPDVQFLINPTLPPDYGVGRSVVIVMDTPIDKQKVNANDPMSNEMEGVERETLPGTEKGEDGNPLSVVLTAKREEGGVIKGKNDDGTWNVEVTQPDGTKTTVKRTEQQIRESNDPTIYDLHGSTYDDVKIDVDNDPSLQKFIAQAKAIADKDIPKNGTPEEKAAGQRQALVDLTLLCNKTMSYPDEEPTTTDANSKKFMEMMNSHSNWDPMKLGDIIDNGRGVCRHQAILMQVCCQVAEISSRMVSAKADDDQGHFRGYHAFLETTLDDGKQYLTDPTWYDAGPSNVQGRKTASPHLPNGTIEDGTPLFDTLYYNARRQVLPTWNENDKEDHSKIAFRKNNDPVIDASSGKVVVDQPAPTPAPTPTPTPAPTVDVNAFLDSVRMAEFHSDYKQWWPNWDPKQASAAQYVKYGDYYGAKDPKSAAVYYSLGIEFGSGMDDATKKALWTKLSDSLAKIPGMDSFATQAKGLIPN